MWGRDGEERRKGWSRDPKGGGWVREIPGGGSTSNLSNANLTNNLRNRPRSNSSVPSLVCHDNDHGGSVSPIANQRGSSASPRTPHSKGFWVQEPDEYHSRWVPTKTPDPDACNTPLTWPPAGGSSSPRAVCLSQPSSPHRAPATPPPLGCSAPSQPKVYKSHATWVRNTDEGAASVPEDKTPISGGAGLPTTPSPTVTQMSGDAGDGSPGGGVDVKDFQNRISVFQRQDKQQQLNNKRTTNNSSSSSTSSSSSSSSSSSQLKRSEHSSSISNLSEVKSSKSNLSELKSLMTEVKSDLSEITSQSSSVNYSSNRAMSAKQQSSSSSSLQGFNKIKPAGFNMGSMDAINNALNMGSSEQLALPDVENEFDLQNLKASQDQLSSSPLTSATGSANNNSAGVKFEQKKMTSTQKTKVVTDNNSYETASGQSSEITKLQAGDLRYAELSKKAESKAKLEIDGITAEKTAAVSKEARQVKAEGLDHREESQIMGASERLAGDGFSVHRAALSEQQQRQTKTPAGAINQESSRKATQSGITIKAQGVCTQQFTNTRSSQNNINITGFEDLEKLSSNSQPGDVQNTILRYSGVMYTFVEKLKNLKVNQSLKDAPTLLENIDDMIRKAWSVPTYGHELGFSLCNVLRTNGGMDLLLDNCRSENSDLKFSSAKVLEQCLTTENRGYVVEKGLQNIVSVACDCTKDGSSVDKSRVGTGILEHLFKHSEGTCSDIIKLGGLDAVLSECRKPDIETLRHCAGALANLSLYGGSDNQQAMIQRKVPMWLFPLAFHHDKNIKYYACLTIAALVANKELEAEVLQSETLNLVEPFVSSQHPDAFANSTAAHRHGQSQGWLQRLLPVLTSKREEARNLAAFHFCMEAGIKKRQGNLELFREIGAIEPLKDVASSPNAIASKYAAQALRLMGEEVPHKLSQQVPLWTPEDVREWVKQIGFSKFCDNFLNSRVDGDLLLQLCEENLKDDIGIQNGILRQRFMRELRKLKLIADYSSCDLTKLNDFLVEIDKEYAEYTYKMLRAGVTKEWLRYLSEEQLMLECGIINSIHRQKLRHSILNETGQLQDTSSLDKTLDVFISYRRSNGSHLASLLKVDLQLRDFSVFIDVERLRAGKFDNNLLNSIRQAKNFLLVLTQNALDRCVGDTECKDWVHREIVAALQAGCNIIPIIDNFQWPEPEELPEDMRAICSFNGVRWIHEYHNACVDKMERFMRGDDIGRYTNRSVEGGMATPGTPSNLPRAPPLYQRTTSTESGGKCSSCSDKDPKD